EADPAPQRGRQPRRGRERHGEQRQDRRHELHDRDRRAVDAQGLLQQAVGLAPRADEGASSLLLGRSPGRALRHGDPGRKAGSSTVSKPAPSEPSSRTSSTRRSSKTADPAGTLTLTAPGSACVTGTTAPPVKARNGPAPSPAGCSPARVNRRSKASQASTKRLPSSRDGSSAV